MDRWLTECSVDAVQAALRVARPDLADHALVLDSYIATGDPVWCHTVAFIDDQWVVKFAWSQEAAMVLAREGRLFRALRDVTPALPVPQVEVVDEPVLIIYPLVPGTTLTIDQAGALTPSDRRALALALAGVLAQLHAPDTLSGLRRLDIGLEHPVAQADTTALRERFHRIVDHDRARMVEGWCDWADRALTAPTSPAFLHGDFYGENVIFEPGLRSVHAVLDLEGAGFGDPNFDFRYLPGQAPATDLFLDTVDAYQRESGRHLDLNRICAWHLCTVLGDALWRTHADVELPGGGTPAEWVDELDARLGTLGVIAC